MTYKKYLCFTFNCTLLVLVIFSLNVKIKSQQSCIPSFFNVSDSGNSWCIAILSVEQITRNQVWNVRYPDEQYGSNIGTGGFGQCFLSLSCPPQFDYPTASNYNWKQRIVQKYIYTDVHGDSSCASFSETIYTKPPRACTSCGNAAGITCSSGGGSGGSLDELCEEMEAECFASGGTWKGCNRGCYSPIVVDVLGNGFNLTDGNNGVLFDLTGEGTKDKIAWTSANSDDAWLVLDRNGNGMIDNALELFGNFTDQPQSIPVKDRNGFLALAEFDKSANGGNGDGGIDQRDTIFNQLRLWQDFNHNSISEANELKPLLELDVTGIEVRYQESKRTDEFGNRFKYRAKVWDARNAKVGRWAWDVFPVRPR